MKLNDIINESAQREESHETLPLDDNEIEKLAEYLEAFSEEDTLLDDLARAAVIADMLEKQYGH